MERCPLTADGIAEHLVWFAHQHGAFISNLKLQKLLYYAQGWHLALFNVRLFDDPVEAWVHGPVVPSIYKRFKTHGFRHIDEHISRPNLPDYAVRFLGDLLDAYLGIDAYALELLTHQEDPWLNARGDLAPDSRSRRRIAIDDMRRYFKARLKEVPAS